MGKALIYVSVASMIKAFNMENIKILQELGYDVEVAGNFETGSTISDQQLAILKKDLEKMGIVIHHIPFSRSIFDISSLIKSYKLTKKLFFENSYKLIHCHAPISSAVCRLAFHSMKLSGSTRMIYTAHGFHFYKGGPKLNWIIFYPIEKWLSRYTDLLITINDEDFDLARKKFKQKSIIKLDGVGISYDKIQEANANRVILEEHGIKSSDFVILSVGELNDNKNHLTIIKAIEESQDSTLKYLIAGVGENETKYKEYISKNKLEKQIFLLGYRTDVPNISKAVNVFAFPSIREGLGLAAVEAMAAGLPILTSSSERICEYSINEVTGYNYSYDNWKGFLDGIRTLKNNPSIAEEMGKNNVIAARKYDINEINKEMRRAYEGDGDKKDQ